MRLTNDLTIVRTTVEDAVRLAEIIGCSFADVAVRFDLTPQNCPKHPSNCTPAWIEKDFVRGVQYFILAADEDDLGCVGVEPATPTTCYMERLAVLPQHRGKGYGTLLAQHAIERARSLGAERVGIGIIAADTGLKGFYASLGFEAGEVKNFDHLPFEVAFMRLSLCVL